jgi:hypothetical protein
LQKIVVKCDNNECFSSISNELIINDENEEYGENEDGLNQKSLVRIVIR